MSWWQSIFKRRRASNLHGLDYSVAFTLYSKDGNREAEVREFSNGETYLAEREFDGAEFKERHSGRMVGPFTTPADAEKFVVATEWFRGLGK